MARRARKRWLATLLVALAVTGLTVVYRARKQRRFNAAIVIRVEERTFDERTRPVASGAITNYLYDVSLSRAALRAVVKKHNLYPELMDFDENLAIEEMHDDIDVKVVQNYFLLERYIENPVRSARIVLTYTGRDPDRSLAVVRELGGLIAFEQARTREQVGRLTYASAADMTRMLNNEINRARREQVSLNMIRDKTPLQIVQLRRVTAEIEQHRNELALHTERRKTLDLRTELERRAMGLQFEIADNGRPPRVVLTRKSELVLVALLVFFFGVPLAGISVGTLDLKIRDIDSLRHLGVACFGHIPAFDGDDVGSYNSRSETDRIS